MSSSGGVLTETLRSITTAKLKELSKKRVTFEEQKNSLLLEVQQDLEPKEIVRKLVEGVKKCFSVSLDLASRQAAANRVDNRLYTKLYNYDRFLQQARYDASLSANLVQEWELSLLKQLNVQTLKYQYATLYGELVMEWLFAEQRATGKPATVSEESEPAQPSTRTEKVEHRKQWENTVFQTFEISQDAIEGFLSNLFGKAVNKPAFDALETFRKRVEAFEINLALPGQFNPGVLQSVIRSLISSDLLTDDNNTALKGFLESSIILSELADVFNMRMTALENWEWEDVVLIEQQRRVNGNYGIHMHEDLLQSIFLHYIGVKWSVFFKQALVSFYKDEEVWKPSCKPIPKLDRNRREYFIIDQRTTPSVHSKRQQLHRCYFFMSKLLNTVEQGVSSKDGQDEAELPADLKISRRRAMSSRALYKAVETPPTESEIEINNINFILKDDDGSPVPQKNPMEIKQLLLHLLSTEILGEPRIRKRGVPESHVLSDVLGEIVLFSLDYSFNQATDGAQLYRLHDEFWYWSSSHETCIKGWAAIKNFAATIGVSLNEAKTGSERILADREVLPNVDPSLPQGEIRWGFLSLDPERGRFVIDQSMVDAHIKELEDQLASTTSIFSWVQAWNTYAGTFFSTNFGTPANCFGQSHIDEILSTLARLQTTIFDPSTSSGSGGVAGYLKSALSQRFNINDIPDGYLYFPTSLGGLELQNNLIPFLQVRDTILQDPIKILRDDFFEAEAKFYRGLKTDWEQNGRLWPYLNNEWQPEDKLTFFSYEEFVRYREQFSGGYAGDLYEVYCELLRQPVEQTVSVAAADEVWLNDLGVNKSAQSGETFAVGNEIGPWEDMSSYWKWVAQLYGPDMVNRFGGLAIVDRGWLPVGMVGLYRAGRVKWQG